MGLLYKGRRILGSAGLPLATTLAIGLFTGTGDAAQKDAYSILSGKPAGVSESCGVQWNTPRGYVSAVIETADKKRVLAVANPLLGFSDCTDVAALLKSVSDNETVELKGHYFDKAKFSIKRIKAKDIELNIK